MNPSGLQLSDFWLAYKNLDYDWLIFGDKNFSKIPDKFINKLKQDILNRFWKD